LSWAGGCARLRLCWMWCAVSKRRRHLAVNRRVRSQSADSGAVRSHRVPNLKRSRIFVTFWDNAGSLSGRNARSQSPPQMFLDCAALSSRQTPCDHGCFQCAAGFMIAPLTIDKITGERKLIGSAVILAQHLDRQARRRFPCAIEFRQSSFACCHLCSPLSAARPRRILIPPPGTNFLHPAHRSNHNAGMRFQCDNSDAARGL
jgi:hypothetical protein